MLAMSLIVGLLTLVGIPRYIQSAEHAKAIVGIEFLRDIQAAQQAHFDRAGRYADSIDLLDLSHPMPPYFSIGAMRCQSPRDWSLTLTRVGSDFAFGDYQIEFDQDGLVKESRIATNVVERGKLIAATQAQ